MEKLDKQHIITKNISKSGLTHYYGCEEHNASYPTLRMLKDVHPNLDEDKIIEFSIKMSQLPSEEFVVVSQHQNAR